MKKNIIIVLLLVIVVCLAALLFFKKDNNVVNNTNNEENNQKKIYEADEYISLEDVSFSPRVSVKKVKFNHLSDEVTKQFYEDQQKVIDNIHPSDSDIFNAQYNLKYDINNNILSVVYMIEEANEIGICGTLKAVTNIDLINNKVISEEELLEKAGTNYQKMTEEFYDKELASWSELNKNANREIDFYDVTFKDYSTNKDKYVNIGVEKIPDVIYTYIEDGKIKYDYYIIKIDTLFHQVGKGGCFYWETVTLGDYK